MRHGSILWRGGVVALLLLGGCKKATTSGAGPASSAKPAATKEASPKAPATSDAKPASSAKKSETSEAAAPAPAALAPVAERGALLHRLPKTTLLAIRLPHVEKLKETWERTQLHTLFESPLFGAQMSKMQSGFEQMAGELAKTQENFDVLKEQALSLTGELVVALTSVDARALLAQSTHSDRFPVTGAVLFDAGTKAEAFESLMQALFNSMATKGDAKEKIELVSSGSGRWHRRVQSDGVCVDFVRDGSQFAAGFGPTSDGAAEAAPFSPRPLDDSFVAAEIVRATPDLGKSGSTPVAEFYVNLAPIWSAIDVLAPTEVKNVLTGSGATSIQGMAAAAALGKSGIDEVLVLDSPGCKDLLSQTLVGRHLNTTLARYLPADAPVGTLCSFDFGALFDGVTKLLPANERKGLDAGLNEMKKQGIDLRADVITNLGPTIGFSGSGDLFDLSSFASRQEGAPIDFTLLIELQDTARFRRTIEKFLKDTGIGARTRLRTVEGSTVSSVEPVPVPGPTGEHMFQLEPNWCFEDHAFLFSTSSSSLRRALTAAKEPGNRGPPAVKAALAQDGGSLWSIGSMAVRAGGPASTTIGRRTASGLELSTHDGPGTLSTTLIAGGAGVAAAVAIPSLMKSRAATNEQAALATLRSIDSAQEQFRMVGAVDPDANGHGEFGTLAELTGTAPLRGSKRPLRLPLLEAKMAPDDHGCFTRAGYCFRVDVIGRTMRGSERTEPRFVAYAWPVEVGTTGTKVYVVSNDDGVFFSDNHGDGQNYSGQERAPRTDASDLRDPGDRMNGVTAVRRGRDGGIWLELK